MIVVPSTVSLLSLFLLRYVQRTHTESLFNPLPPLSLYIPISLYRVSLCNVLSVAYFMESMALVIFLSFPFFFYFENISPKITDLPVYDKRRNFQDIPGTSFKNIFRGNLSYCMCVVFDFCQINLKISTDVFGISCFRRIWKNFKI